MVKSGTDIVYFSFFYYFCNENVTKLNLYYHKNVTK